MLLMYKQPLLPDERWALQVSAGFLNDAEEVTEPAPGRVDVVRTTASATYHHPFAGGAILAATGAWGMNDEDGEGRTQAGLLEGNLHLGMSSLFGRGEVVQKDAHDLGLEGSDEKFVVGKVSLGYLRELGTWVHLVPGLGIEGLVSLVPDGPVEKCFGILESDIHGDTAPSWTAPRLATDRP